MKTYAGVGSRKTPNHILAAIKRIAAQLGRPGFFTATGYELQSGGASGADSAFEAGCDSVSGRKKIWLPWPRFNGNQSALFTLPHEAFVIAAKFHPAWNTLSDPVKKLMARNSLQILPDLKTPVEFVLCYTPGGSGQGGTGQALRIANQFKVPVFDFGRTERDAVDRIENAAANFIRKLQ